MSPLPKEHARSAQVHERYRTLPGDAYNVDFGNGYDVALITNVSGHALPAPETILLAKK